MKAHRGQTPLMDWLNGGEHAVFLSRVPYTASWLVRPSVTKIYIRNMSETVVLSEEDRKILYKEQREHFGYSHSYTVFCDEYITPYDSKFTTVIERLDKDREYYKAFFMDMVKYKRLDEQNFNAIIIPHLKNELKFCTRNDPFHATLEWRFQSNITIQDYIEYYYIISPALDQVDDTLAMVRICPKCSKLFVAKTNKTIFCSPSCRVIYQRKKGPVK